MQDAFRLFPRRAEDLEQSPIGAQLFEGAGFDGTAQAVWVEQTSVEWVMAWFVRGEPELACAWRKSLAGGLGSLAQVWGGPLAQGLSRGKNSEEDRSRTLFLTLQMHAGALTQKSALPYTAWRPALALQLASQAPGAGFVLSDEEERVISAIDDLLRMRPALRRPDLSERKITSATKKAKNDSPKKPPATAAEPRQTA